MKLLVIIIVILTLLFKLIIKFLNLSSRYKPIPSNVTDIFDYSTYENQKRYEMNKVAFSVFTDIFIMLIILAFLCFNFHYFIFNSLESNNLFITTYVVYGVPKVILMILDYIFSFYFNFKIEAKHGFNRSTKKGYVVDCFKSFIINLIINLGILSIFLILYTKLNDWVYIIFFFVFALLIFFISVFNKTLKKVFNILTPLQEGELKNKITQFTNKVEFPIDNVLVLNASTRSSHIGAFLAGFGNTKTVILYDTLIDKMVPSEIIAVIAHEIGHAKKKHDLHYYFYNLYVCIISMCSLYLLLEHSSLSLFFGFNENNLAFGLYLIEVVMAPVMLILNIPVLALRRKLEFDADKFAKTNHDTQSIVSALKKTAKVNFKNLSPHPFVVLVEYDHPPIDKRISALESL